MLKLRVDLGRRLVVFLSVQLLNIMTILIPDSAPRFQSLEMLRLHLLDVPFFIVACESREMSRYASHLIRWVFQASCVLFTQRATATAATGHAVAYA